MIVLGALLAGCFDHHKISVTGRELHRHLAELRDRGIAVVDADHDRVHGPSTVDHVRIYGDRPVVIKARLQPISDLFDDCSDTLPIADLPANPREKCELVQRRYQHFELDRYDSFRTGATVAAVVILGAIGGIGFAAAATEDSIGGKVAAGLGAGAGTALVLGLVWMFVDCAGKWGQPGCRD